MIIGIVYFMRKWRQTNIDENYDYIHEIDNKYEDFNYDYSYEAVCSNQDYIQSDQGSHNDYLLLTDPLSDEMKQNDDKSTKNGQL